ncbi:amino acid ABC transporter permease [Olsenella profusa]|uniref:Amino acid ABC transporter permease n=1 Tax=Olsenella profusa TaxID=138595 RepID=A0ABS2F283_9ACTN|nr:amino acid ABC transporter permease [Olsenella profusa]MBM6774902.1 amino acid ABC transporter permease [Olsenella profusa]
MSSAATDERAEGRGRGRIASFLLDDHRYVLLGTSAMALVGMLLSSSPRPALSFLAPAFTVELVLYYVLAAWLVLSAVALVYKLTHWRTYAEVAPFVRPGARRALRYLSYVIWAVALVFVADRVVMGFASAWQVATTAADRPADEFLTNLLWMFWTGRQTYLTGIYTTIALAVFGTVIAFFLALLLVFCRIQAVDRPDNDFVRFWKVVGRGFAKVYSTVVRGTPMMVQGMIIYYGVVGFIQATGSYSGAELNRIWSPFIAGLVTVSLNSTAYMMEVLRGGIAAVDSGQMEAARSLGLSQWQAMRKVVFPQGIKNSIPGLSNELVINIKDSSVLSMISVFDLTFAARTIGGNYYEYFPAYLVAAVIYLVLTSIATSLLGRGARHFDVKPQPVGGTADQGLVSGEE